MCVCISFVTSEVDQHADQPSIYDKLLARMRLEAGNIWESGGLATNQPIRTIYNTMNTILNTSLNTIIAYKILICFRRRHFQNIRFFTVC